MAGGSKSARSPRGWRERALGLFLRGFAMGTADIIPGVSGGTIAFITGIYLELVAAIRSVDAAFVSDLLRLRFREAFGRIPFGFLVPLCLGIGLALVSTARLTHFLLERHPVLVWAFFFGLILASIVVMARRIGGLDAAALSTLALGALVSWLIVSIAPVSSPDDWWIILGSGAVAICAMILPGISGAFILLILGKYELVTGALKNPFAPGSLALLAVFAVGCVFGLMCFSRILHYFLTRRWKPTMAFLTGFMIGALGKVWPWKEVLETQVIRGKVHVLREGARLPRDFGIETWVALALALAGLMMVLLLETLSSRGLGRRPRPESARGEDQ